MLISEVPQLLVRILANPTDIGIKFLVDAAVKYKDCSLASGNGFQMGSTALLACILLSNTAPCVAEVDNNSVPAESSVVGKDLMTLALVGNMFEIQSSEIALARATSDKVKEFARDMISSHTQANLQIKVIIDKRGDDPHQPQPQLGSQDIDMIDRLRSVQSPEFDRLYLRQQLRANMASLDLMQSYAAQGNPPELTELAATMVPIIRRHIAMLHGLNAS